ncbi:MAG: hypothetical protein MJZ24_08045 [Paludibacteraceae bacterium]|nr:hypothetical protein [Paludibacteraceae bacterium]
MNFDNKQGCNMNTNGCSKHTNNKLDTFDWLCDIPEAQNATDFVEIVFKNTRKGYYRNTNGLLLKKGDIVAVEATPGHDIGTVNLTGQLVLQQMKKNKIDPLRSEIKRVYRIAREVDLEKYEEAKAKEHEIMLKSRRIAEDLQLNMKIGDVEFQGDGNKAIFYYIADERVDFRQLIKVLADTFKVRIEMKQIGARQEAGRIGGIGPCGRPLCCSSWLSNFVSVSTSAARYQEISLNPQKLAGQCAKLKCCLNFETDTYIEAQKSIPPRDIPLETKDGTFYHFKTDVFAQTMQYSSDPRMAANLVTLSVNRVKEIMELNKRGEKVDNLLDEESQMRQREEKAEQGYQNVVGQDSLTRFDKKKKKKNKKEKGAQGNEPQQEAGNANTTGERRDRGDRRDRNRDRRDRRQEHGQRNNNGGNGENRGADGENPVNNNVQNEKTNNQSSENLTNNNNVQTNDPNNAPSGNNEQPQNGERRDRGDRNRHHHGHDRRDRNRGDHNRGPRNREGGRPEGSNEQSNNNNEG